jgi:hypothetical protein
MDRIRYQKQHFAKSWPPGCDPPMSAFDYFNNKFKYVDGYNWWLLPSVNEQNEPRYWGVFEDGTITMKFIHLGDFTPCIREVNDDRIGVVIEHDDALLHLYMDDEAYLYGDTISACSIGRLTTNADHADDRMKSNMWDGFALLDFETISIYHPLTIRKQEWT